MLGSWDKVIGRVDSHCHEEDGRKRERTVGNESGQTSSGRRRGLNSDCSGEIIEGPGWRGVEWPGSGDG